MCGECLCNPPYFGTYCELCSGDEVCQTRTCDVDGDNAMCTLCAVNLLQDAYDAGIRSELFSDDFIEAADGTLPTGSMLAMEEDGQLAIRLPDSFSASCSMGEGVSCPGLVIINQNFMEIDYEIQGEYGIISYKLERSVLVIFMFYASI